MTDFRETALLYASDGWATHPLRYDSNGFAKVAIVENWQTLQPEDAQELDWAHARGIGIIGGANSCNLGFIDIDDEGLAADAFAWLVRQHKCPLMAYTARKRLHVYVIEPEPSQTRKLRQEYREEPVLVELRSTGAYVAAPPTQGYEWANKEWEPLYSTLTDAWNEIAKGVGVTWPKGGSEKQGAGYPPAWQKHVPAGQRNDALFIEACRLREAGLPIQEAVNLLEIRFRNAYEQGGLSWKEQERTIRSAYARAGSSDSTWVRFRK